MTDAPADNRTRTLAAARALFFEKGFAATSSRAIAQKAGTSKATIYAAFGSMEGLLAAVIADEVARFDAPGGAEIMDFESFRAAMVTFGGRLLTFLGDPETFRFSRIMHEEARGRPEVTRVYFEAAYQGTCDRVAEMMAAGALFADSIDPDLPNSAERYVAFLKGHRYEMAVLGLLPEPYPKPQETSAACFDAWFAPRDHI